MQFISCHDGKLLRLNSLDALAQKQTGFVTGLPALDALLPGGVFSHGSVHELLAEPGNPPPLFFAALLAKAAGTSEAENNNATIIWCDSAKAFYSPALVATGLQLKNLLLLHPRTPAEHTWAANECLRCKGVRAVIAAPARLSRTEARRLQLSAEKGGGVGLLLRTIGQSPHYAAATRWLIRPTSGERTVQKWEIQLLHGHGGLVGQNIVLERSRENGRVVAVAESREIKPLVIAITQAS